MANKSEVTKAIARKAAAGFRKASGFSNVVMIGSIFAST